MFAGIVTALGRVCAVDETGGVHTLMIESPYADLAQGESVAVNGACLTVVAVSDTRFSANVMGPTRSRTRLGELAVGAQVNLERALAVGDRIGGHFVQGHVDAVAVVTRVREEGDALLVDVAIPLDISQVTVLHGSIALDGVSLTVNAVPEPGELQVALIPHTRSHTTLGGLRAGDRVHVEGDLMGKLVRQLVQPWLAAAAESR